MSRQLTISREDYERLMQLYNEQIRLLKKAGAGTLTQSDLDQILANDLEITKKSLTSLHIYTRGRCELQ